jgi:hypothetical protein
MSRKPTQVNWVQEVKIGAARKLGADHYRLIVTLAVLRRALPGLIVLAAFALVGYLMIGATSFVLGVATVAAGTAVALLALIWAWRHWSWMVVDLTPIPGPAVAVLAFLLLLGVGGALVAFWIS